MTSADKLVGNIVALCYEFKRERPKGNQYEIEYA